MKNRIISAASFLILFVTFSNLKAQPGPGGISTGGKLWFEANTGVVLAGMNVTQWMNQFNATSVIATVTASPSNPQFINPGTANAFNYNPVIVFNGTNHFFISATSVDFNEIGLRNATHFAIESFVVAHGSSTGFFWGFQPYNTSPAGNKLGSEAWNCHMVGSTTGSASLGFLPGINPLTPVIANFSGADGVPIVTYYNMRQNTGGNISVYNTSYTTANFVIGGFDYASGGPYYLLNGRLAEVITYNRQLTIPERTKVNSYLAIKYGLTLGLNAISGGVRCNYLSSTGINVWTSANTGDPMYDFHNDIAGIARDNAELLHQKQSVSQNVLTPFHVTMGLDTIAADNVSNPDNLVDSTYMLWGDNGDDASNYSIYVANCEYRIARKWRIQETGVVDSVMLSIPASAMSLAPGQSGFLIVSQDTVFNSSDIFIQLTSNGTNLECKYNFANGDYFTFARSSLPPVASVTGDTICQGDTATLTVSGSGNYHWSTGETSSTIFVTPLYSTSYFVTVTSGPGCADSAMAGVVVNLMPVISITNDTSICKGNALNIIVSGGVTYLWSTGQNTPQISVSPALTTAYTVTVTTSTGCSSDTSITIIVFPDPQIGFQTIPNQAEGCNPVTINFTDTTSPAIQAYAWLFGDGTGSSLQNPTHLYSTPGTFDVTLSVVTNDGCSGSLTRPAYINVFPLPVADFYPTPQVAPRSRPVIDFNSSGTSPYVTSWSWNFGDPYSSENTSTESNPLHIYNQTGTYTVWLIVITTHGCKDSISRTVIIKDDDLIIPNIITPNGDGINDYFMIKNLDNYDYNELIIYDRWGKVIYKKEPYTPDTDAWKGEGMSDGTYYFILKFRGFNLEGQRHGSITVLR